MNSIIAIEHFELTPPYREEIEKYLSKLDRILPDDCALRVHLTLDNQSQYRALCKAHVTREELVSEEKAYDLHTAIAGAFEHFRKRVLRAKGRKNFSLRA